MTQYEGNERRSQDKRERSPNQKEDHELLMKLGTDHDLLITLSILFKNQQALLEKHMEDDKASLHEINESLKWLQKITYMILGALFVLQAIPSIVNILKTLQ